ncbi:hypothetical protein [Amycolatopsis sp. BJA-103]|uniref:hypothetical protein n=1 Tax=Amycolatopsis sp. BJA-103 TaxID=1911175 RepID=UPI001304AFCE|nr:hypothetical protein [Amycolatopsis sp. BJA-103]
MGDLGITAPDHENPCGPNGLTPASATQGTRMPSTGDPLESRYGRWSRQVVPQSFF